MKGYRKCKRGESPKPKKSGYGASARKAMERGELKMDKKGQWWIKNIDGAA